MSSKCLQTVGWFTRETFTKLEKRICRQIQDLHANFLHKREKEAQRLFAKLHITRSLLQGVEIELKIKLIFALQVAVF